jgi:hypothetical protein
VNLHQRNNIKQKDALDAELETEIRQLATATMRDNPVEAVMRFRALIEISNRLCTEALVALAVQVTVEGRNSGCSKLVS